MADKLLPQWLWIHPNDLNVELLQLIEEGRDVTKIRRRLRNLAKKTEQELTTPRLQAKAQQLLDEAAELPQATGYRYHEPSDLSEIRKARPRKPRGLAGAKRPSDRTLADRMHAAWIGRCAGCLLGKPIEGQPSDKVWPFLKDSRQWPLRGYLRMGRKGQVADKHPEMVQRNWFDKIDHMPVDDDTNYTVLGVRIVQERGAEFTPHDVAEMWMHHLPILLTFTAERVAYRNLVMNIAPPDSATFRNPFREWIGAQIRADAYGYLAAGDPARAAEWAWRDASISHVKNGIYGAMFVAAMTAAAPMVDDIPTLVRAGLAEIPADCRLAEAIHQALDWHAGEVPYDDVVARIHQTWDEHEMHGWVHTIPNAVIVAVAMLYCEGSFGQGICRAVQPCYDTDCNGATVGSILGMHLGTGAIPAQWTEPLNDTLETSLSGAHRVSIRQMAKDTFALHKKLR